MKELFFASDIENYLEQILEIYNDYINHSTATFHLQTITLKEMKEILLFNDPRFSSYAILEEGRLCGYVILARYSIREAYDITAEVTVYLDKNFTGRGIGRKALEFIEQKARDRNFHSLIAKICGENKESIRLFEKAGYVKCAHYTGVGYKFGRLLDVVSYQKIIV
jgi:L-amino acid N-acyltransferase YncA